MPLLSAPDPTLTLFTHFFIFSPVGGARASRWASTPPLSYSPALLEFFSSLVLLGLTVRVREAAVCSSTPASMPLHPSPSPVPVSRHRIICSKMAAAARLRDSAYQRSRLGMQNGLHSECPLPGKHLQTCKGRGWECRMAGASWPCHLFPPPASLSLHTPVWP